MLNRGYTPENVSPAGLVNYWGVPNPNNPTDMRKSKILEEVKKVPSPRDRGYWTVDEVIRYLKHSFRDGNERVIDFHIDATSFSRIHTDDPFEMGSTSFMLNADKSKLKPESRLP